MSPFDHRLEVGDELLVNWVVGGVKCVKGGGAGAVEDPEHGKVLEILRLRSFLFHKPRLPGLWPFVTPVGSSCRAAGVPLEERVDPNLARQLNQEIRRIAEALADPAEDDVPFAFVCECGCEATVMLTLGQFDRDGGAWLEGHKPR